jgi:hypothetical protein
MLYAVCYTQCRVQVLKFDHQLDQQSQGQYRPKRLIGFRRLSLFSFGSRDLPFKPNCSPMNTGSRDSTTNMNSSSGKSKSSSCQWLIKLSIQQVLTGGNLEMGLLMLRVLQH